METLGGSLFAVAGAGESHGPAITTIVFGCPPGLRISRAEIQHYLDRRRPGSNKLGTPRREGDKVVILSGVYSEDHDLLLSGSRIAAAVGDEEVSAPGYEEGLATGEPIAAVVLSAAKRTADYEQFLGPTGDVRPGHTDLVKHHKSRGFADPRGGGRSSFRSTISDVFGGSVARLYLRDRFGTAFLSSICQVGELRSGRWLADHVHELSTGNDGRVPAAELEELEAALEEPEIRTLDAEFAGAAADLISETRRQGDSIGAAIEVVAVNVPPLAGEPLYDSLKVRLMGTLGGLHAVQACEVGSGIEVVPRRGSENNDPIRRSGYQGNHHGGIIGGVTTGMPLVCRVSFKPTSTIRPPQQSVRKDLSETDFELQKGRHDPCVGVRASVTLESRMAIELMDAVLAHQSKRVDAGNFELF
jgi:chorismate synthase